MVVQPTMMFICASIHIGRQISYFRLLLGVIVWISIF